MRAVSLFSNCGAGDLGYSRAGFRFEVMAELDPRRLQVAALNHPSSSVVWGDLRETWPTVVEMWRNAFGDSPPDLLAACPPCQGLSSARSDRGEEADPDAGSRDYRNLLVEVVAAVVAELTPRYVVLENVPAFLTRAVRHPDSGQPISAATLLISRLEGEYDAFPLLTNLQDFGVPQSRVRSFLTFVRKTESSTDELEAKSAAPYPVPRLAVEYGGKGGIVLREALNQFGLPALDARSPDTAVDPDRKLHVVPVWKDRRYDIVAAIPAGSGRSAWLNRCPHCSDVEPDEEDVLCRDCGEVLPRPAVKEENGEWRLVRGFRASSYRRLNPNEPAATITTASGNLGSDRTVHPWENRLLSPLECALLQTFPVSFDWGSALEKWGATNVRRMIGEAVPPAFTEQHGRVLAALMNGQDSVELLTSSDSRVRKAAHRLTRGRYKKSRECLSDAEEG